MTVNLLPTEDRRLAGREQLRRSIVLASILFITLLLIGAVLLVPSFVLLRVRQEMLTDAIAEIRATEAIERSDAIEQEISLLNRELRLIDANGTQQLAVAPLLLAILSRLPAGVSLRSVLYRAAEPQPDMEIQGKGETRENLLAFIDALRAETQFTRVTSPVANLLADKNVEFSLIIELGKAPLANE